MSSDKPRRTHGRDRDIGEHIGKHIDDEPLTALAIAGAAGFILGGGAGSRIGLAALAMVGKIALRGAATNFLVGLFVPKSGSRRSERARSSRRRNQDKREHQEKQDTARP